MALFLSYEWNLADKEVTQGKVLGNGSRERSRFYFQVTVATSLFAWCAGFSGSDDLVGSTDGVVCHCADNRRRARSTDAIGRLVFNLRVQLASVSAGPFCF